MNPQAQGSEAAESAAAGRLARARPVVWTGRVLAAVAGVAVLGWMMLATYFSPLEPPWIRVGLAALVLVGAASGLLLVRPLRYVLGGILAGIFGEILDLDEDFMPFVVIAMMLGGVMQALHISHARHAKSLPARRAQLEFIADRLVMLASAPDATR